MKRKLRSLSLVRRSRHMWSLRLWRPRLVFWAGAIAIGLISVAFAKLSDGAQHLFATAIGNAAGGSLWALVMTPAGFTLSAWAGFVLFPGAQGSGIPQAIAARVLPEDEDRSLLLSIRLVLGKIALTIVGLAAGASIGREGPTVQVGASIMLQAGRIGRMGQAQGLILAGSAAGIAAAFNTPLAGIVFAIEEMGRAYQARTNGIVLSTVILAGLAALAIVGNYDYFGTTTVRPQAPMDWLLAVVCGVGGGALGGLFSTLALRGTRRIRRLMQPQPLVRTLLLAGVCGLAVAMIGILSGGETFGTGYMQARGAVEGHAVAPLFFAAKFAATLLSMLSGIAGGIFAPSLAVGAGLGSAIGQLMGASIPLAAVLGMAGYFAGVVQAPMTAFVIILEMTGNHDNVIPLMLTAMLGYGTARLLTREPPLYHGLSRLFVADALRRRRAAAKTG